MLVSLVGIKGDYVIRLLGLVWRYWEFKRELRGWRIWVIMKNFNNLVFLEKKKLFLINVNCFLLLSLNFKRWLERFVFVWIRFCIIFVINRNVSVVLNVVFWIYVVFYVYFFWILLYFFIYLVRCILFYFF